MLMVREMAESQRVYQQWPSGKRSRLRPSKRCIEPVEEDLRRSLKKWQEDEG